MLNEQEEDSSEESDIEVVFETQALNNDDLAKLRPHDFSLPVSNVSDSTAVKEIEGRGLNVIGEVSDGTGTVDGGTERGGTVQFGEINDNIVPNVEGQGDGKDELDLCTKCVSPKYLPNKWLHFEKMLLVLLSKFKMHTKSECSGGVSW